MWIQKSIKLQPRQRGFHLITAEVSQQLPELRQIAIGLVHFHLQHTSASLSINENADHAVRSDMEAHFNELAPEGASYYQHTCEGPDDMPAHVRSALTQSNLSIPIVNGRLALGTWQGIYLWEHRRSGSNRRVLVHIQ